MDANLTRDSRKHPKKILVDLMSFVLSLPFIICAAIILVLFKINPNSFDELFGNLFVVSQFSVFLSLIGLILAIRAMKQKSRTKLAFFGLAFNLLALLVEVIFLALCSTSGAFS